MPRLKAELFDSIKASGEIGITTDELYVMHYGHEPQVQKSVIKSHVNQINDLLVETDYKIESDGRGPHARWVLTKHQYDADDDFADSLNEGYRAIKERQASGGPGWTPREVK